MKSIPLTLTKTEIRLCPVCKGHQYVKTVLYCDVFNDITGLAMTFERQLLHIECPVCNGTGTITKINSKYYTEDDFKKFIDEKWDKTFVPLKEKYKISYNYSVVPVNRILISLDEINRLIN